MNSSGGRIDMASARTPLVARCVKLAGSFPAGVLLYRILFWNTRNKVIFNGEEWIVNSNERWAEEIGATSRVLDIAFAVLKRKGLIRSEIHLFKSRRYAHLQVTQKALFVVMDDHQTVDMDDHQMVVLNKKGVLEGSSGKESGELAFASEKTQSQKEAAEDETMKEVQSVNDLKAAYEAQGLLHKPDKNPLSLTWTKLVAAQSKGFAPNLTAKDKGQLRMFAQKCPEGSAVAVMTYAVNNWTWFASQAKSEKAVTQAPSSPYIGFLLAHADIAIKLALAPKTPKPAAIAVDKSMPLTAPKKVPKPNMPTSLAEIMADPDEDL